MSTVQYDLHELSGFLNSRTRQVAEAVRREAEHRASLASREMKEASDFVLSGKRSGRMYKASKFRAFYRASVPGEPPAQRTGRFKASWHSTSYSRPGDNGSVMIHSALKSSYVVGKVNLGKLLEHGSRHMAARPYEDAVVERALPKIEKIYKRPYKGR